MLQWDRGFQRAAPTALSGSGIKPPALPEVSNYSPSTESAHEEGPSARQGFHRRLAAGAYNRRLLADMLHAKCCMPHAQKVNNTTIETVALANIGAARQKVSNGPEFQLLVDYLRPARLPRGRAGIQAAAIWQLR